MKSSDDEKSALYGERDGKADGAADREDGMPEFPCDGDGSPYDVAYDAAYRKAYAAAEGEVRVMALSKEERAKQAELNECYAEWKRASDAFAACDNTANADALDRADKQLDAKLLEMYGGREA